LDHAAVESIRAQEHAAVSSTVDELGGGRPVGLASGAVADELDADEQAPAADVADRLVPRRELAEAAEESLAGDPGALLEPFVLDDVEHRQADRRGYGVAAERVEVLHAVGERIGDRPGRHDRAERVAVADRLAHRHDVRPGILRGERPRGGADTSEPDLDL